MKVFITGSKGRLGYKKDVHRCIDPAWVLLYNKR